MKNQPIESLLAGYDALTERLAELLKQEQNHLQQGGSLDDTMEAKKGLLGAITDLNVQLKNYGRDCGSMGTRVKTRVEALQNKLMSILKLDRAVEKQYLSVSARASAAPTFAPVPSRVGQAYGKRAG